MLNMLDELGKGMVFVSHGYIYSDYIPRYQKNDTKTFIVFKVLFLALMIAKRGAAMFSPLVGAVN